MVSSAIRARFCGIAVSKHIDQRLGSQLDIWTPGVAPSVVVVRRRGPRLALVDCDGFFHRGDLAGSESLVGAFSRTLVLSHHDIVAR